MESFGNELRVRQGETFSLDMELFADNNQSIPFIVSNARKHPYFVVTVASTKYEKNLRYVKSWWNEYTGKTFYDTVPVYYGEVKNSLTIKTSGTLTVDSVIKTGSEIKAGSNINNEEIEETIILTNDITITAASSLVIDSILTENSIVEAGSIINGKTYSTTTIINIETNIPTYQDVTETYDENYLYYYTREDESINKDLGHKPYHYFYVIYTGNSATDTSYEYSCHVRFSFDENDTGEWVSQNYMYQITLVSGETMSDRIAQIYTDHLNKGWDGEGWPDTNNDYAQYKYIKTVWPYEFQDDIDEDSPLGTIESPEVILQPTKLEVYNNLRTLI